jgi:hypothetical protein
MAKLRIVTVDGNDAIFQITPAIEFAFETYAKKGLHKAFREDEKQSDVYYLAFLCLQKAGVTTPLFGAAFMETLVRVEVLDDDPLD